MSVLRGSHKSLILIARQMGIHIGPNDIPEKYINLNRELMLNELVSLAGTFGMKAKSSKILRLTNGRYIIALRYIESDGIKNILFLDTAKTDPKPQQIELSELQKGWSGDIILLKTKLMSLEGM